MCHWRAPPAVRGAGPAHTAQEGPWGAPAGRPASATLHQPCCHPVSSAVLVWAGRVRCQEGGRGACAEAAGRTGHPVCGRELSVRTPGAPPWPRQVCGVALVAWDVQGKDQTWRVAGEEVSRGPLSYYYYFPCQPTKAAGPARGQSWLRDGGFPEQTLQVVFVSTRAFCSLPVSSGL